MAKKKKKDNATPVIRVVGIPATASLAFDLHESSSSTKLPSTTIVSSYPTDITLELPASPELQYAQLAYPRTQVMNSNSLDGNFVDSTIGNPCSDVEMGT